MRLSIGLCLIIFIFSTCTSSEIGESKDVAQERIYQFYSITCNEEKQSLELFSQFRFAGEDGTTLVLTPSSKIEVNGEVMKIDSTKSGGAFYSLAKKTNDFNGKYKFVFTDFNNKRYENEYVVDSFAIIDLPSEIPRNKAFQLKFKAAYIFHDDWIEINTVGSDSSFTVNYVGTDTSSLITIPAKEINRQKGKLLQLQATLYRHRGTMQATLEGGSMRLKHVLKPFTLKIKD